MKKFTNKKITVDINGVGKETRYSELCLQALKAPPQGGFGLDELEKRMTVHKVLSGHPKEIELEDSYFKNLQDCIIKSKWQILDESILTFMKEIKDIK